jgi:two-component sensor histidine kinase
LISIAEKEAVLAGPQQFATKILREKLSALSRASDAVFEQDNGGGGDADPIDVATIVPSVLRPYGNHCTAIGDAALIRRDAMTTFALFLHELATNSVKYGALSTAAGNVTVRWTTHDNQLHLTWIETGGPQIAAPPKRQGFGTEMVDRVVQSTQGSVSRTWRTEGLVVDLHFPAFVHK